MSHIGIIWEINNKTNPTNIWLNNVYFKYKCGSLTKSRSNLKIPRVKWKWQHTLADPLAHEKESSKRKVYSCEVLNLKSREKLVKWHMSVILALERRRQEDQEFKTSLSDILISKSVWTIQNHISRTNKKPKAISYNREKS